MKHVGHLLTLSSSCTMLTFESMLLYIDRLLSFECSTVDEDELHKIYQRFFKERGHKFKTLLYFTNYNSVVFIVRDLILSQLERTC